jgi:hypothetical protein
VSCPIGHVWILDEVPSAKRRRYDEGGLIFPAGAKTTCPHRINYEFTRCFRGHIA